MTLEEFKTIQVGDIIEIETEEKLEDMRVNCTKYRLDNMSVTDNMLQMHDQLVVVTFIPATISPYRIEVETSDYWWTRDMIKRIVRRAKDNTTQTIKEEDNKNMEIVELYKNKKLKEIEDKKDKAIAELKDASTDYHTVLKLRDKYDIVEINLDRIWNDILNDNDKMVELYEGIIDEAIEAIKTLNNKVAEVNAMLEICETYEQKIEVLKAHDIIGDDLKLKD